MQNAKDTFYEAMKTRLASINPDRTVVVRGAVRPAVVVEENELVLESPLSDCFRLRWFISTMDANNVLPTSTLRCEVLYETAVHRCTPAWTAAAFLPPWTPNSRR